MRSLILVYVAPFDSPVLLDPTNMHAQLCLPTPQPSWSLSPSWWGVHALPRRDYRSPPLSPDPRRSRHSSSESLRVIEGFDSCHSTRHTMWRQWGLIWLVLQLASRSVNAQVRRTMWAWARHLSRAHASPLTAPKNRRGRGGHKHPGLVHPRDDLGMGWDGRAAAGATPAQQMG